jgi:signal transduction histidine kinase
VTVRESVVGVLRRLGLRQRLVLFFALGGLALCSFLATGTYLLAHGYLVDQRERSASRSAFADAAVVRDGLLVTGRPVSEVLGSITPGTTSVVVLEVRGARYSSSLTVSESDVPAAVRSAVDAGRPVRAWTRLNDRSAVVVGLPLPSVDAQFFEIATTDELRQTLGTLRAVLVALTVVTAVAGALIGRAVAARITRPLDDVAAAAGRIAAGDLQTRLAATDDPDLAGIVGSFNAMVDTLDERIARDARFAADVSHELRTPLTALVTSVEVLRGRADDLAPRSRALLDVVAGELGRFRHLLEDLIELARVEAAADDEDVRTPADLAAVVRHSVTESGRAAALVCVDRPVMVRAEPRMLRRALVNLFDNADAHGRGLVAVSVQQVAGSAVVCVDDAGPGVPEADREAIFARFARLAHRTATPGSGLGLSLVSEIVRSHGGSVVCTDAPGGGARFVLRLPAFVDVPATREPAGAPDGSAPDGSPGSPGQAVAP